MSFCTPRVAPEKTVFRPVLAMHSRPEFTGEHMATMTYKEQLLHPNWQRKRLEILKRDDFTCQCCYDSESTLHVHHKRYVKGRMAWEYPDHELITLCADCHVTIEAESEAFRELVARLPIDGPGFQSGAMALIAGWADGEQGLDLRTLFDESPNYFTLGQIANRMGWKLRMHHLMEIERMLTEAPEWVLRDCIDRFLIDVRSHMADPIPAGYQSYPRESDHSDEEI